ncbi:MAG: hypothetical protein KDH17_21995 [Rhodocyclaceae bacterium]|nr:hypothetical protein [Rhodocyclaceae bacterium]
MNLKTRIAKLEQRRAGAEVPLPGLLVMPGETLEERKARFEQERGYPPPPGCPVLIIGVTDARIRPDPD